VHASSRRPSRLIRRTARALRAQEIAHERLRRALQQVRCAAALDDRPSRISTMSSAKYAASCMSWVTSTTVLPSAAKMRFSSSWSS
jgi:hypothetical protein